MLGISFYFYISPSLEGERKILSAPLKFPVSISQRKNGNISIWRLDSPRTWRQDLRSQAGALPTYLKLKFNKKIHTRVQLLKTLHETNYHLSTKRWKTWQFGIIMSIQKLMLQCFYCLEKNNLNFSSISYELSYYIQLLQKIRAKNISGSSDVSLTSHVKGRNELLNKTVSTFYICLPSS